MLFLEYFINFFVIMTCFMQFWAGQERVKVVAPAISSFYFSISLHVVKKSYSSVSIW